MKISIFTTITKPFERQDPFEEAIRCYQDLADEVVIIDGIKPEPFEIEETLLNGLQKVYDNGQTKFFDYPWPNKFDWPFIGQQFQRGYEACTGDWVIHCDLDYIFHENDIPAIKELLKTPGIPAYSFYKYQFLLVDRYNLKSRVVVAVNKKEYGDRIRFDSGGDLCQPSLDGVELKASDVPQAGIPFFNYDFCFKDLSVIEKDWVRFRDAYKRQFGRDFGDFKSMMTGRFNNRSWKHLDLEDHPKYIKERIRNLDFDKFGKNLFGWTKEVAYEDTGKRPRSD